LFEALDRAPINLFDRRIEIVFLPPARIVVLEGARVADPPDVIAGAVGFNIAPLRLSTGEFLADRKGFDDRAVRVAECSRAALK
jgi:hypothetical protein